MNFLGRQSEPVSFAGTVLVYEPVSMLKYSFYLVFLALIFTLLNAFKPLQVDDAAYYYYAAHIAEHPLDPYGFEIFWYQEPEPANHVLAPPVLPYWWAGAIRLFGDRPFMWKTWLLPFSLIFVWALARLFRRFTPGMETPLVWMTVLSPTFLPSLNLMLDVPALALSLFSITVFFNACDRLDFFRALGAGFLAGVAMQTKYTGFLAPAAMLLCGWLRAWLNPSPLAGVVNQFIPEPRERAGLICLSLVAFLIALNVFVGWEVFITFRHGESHFYLEYLQNHSTILNQLQNWSLPLLTLFGGVGPGIALLGWLAMCPRSLPLFAGSVLVFAGYWLTAFGNPLKWTFDSTLFSLPQSWAFTLTAWEQLIFPLFGILGFGIVLGVAWRLARWTVNRGAWGVDRLAPGVTPHAPNPPPHADWFLLLWLALEITGYFAMTPFAAVRRILGIVVVTTVIAGRLASCTCGSARGKILVWSVAIFNSLLGLGFYGVDYLDARASQEMAENAAAFIPKPHGKIWYVGHWGFQFYAEHAGMQPAVPAKWNQLAQEGDWLVVPDRRIAQQFLPPSRSFKKKVSESAVYDIVPLRTVQCYYGTATGVPLEHHEGPRCSVTVYRITNWQIRIE